MTPGNDLKINRNTSIPEGELDFEFTTSSGPGGQHANKASTRVRLAWDVARSDSITDRQRQLIMKRLSSRINKHGVLQLWCQATRSQSGNREEVKRRFVELVRGALKRQKKRKRTRPTAGSKRRRLEEKRKHSQKKQRRSETFEDRIP